MNIQTSFPLGQVVATSNAVAQLDQSDIDAALKRDAARDWGDLTPDDRKVNEDAVENGGQLLSSYESSAGTKFWIITDADRSATTVLLPEDY
jgi:hypothetical protein